MKSHLIKDQNIAHLHRQRDRGSSIFYINTGTDILVFISGTVDSFSMMTARNHIKTTITFIGEKFLIWMTLTEIIVSKRNRK